MTNTRHNLAVFGFCIIIRSYVFREGLSDSVIVKMSNIQYSESQNNMLILMHDTLLTEEKEGVKK